MKCFSAVRGTGGFVFAVKHCPLMDMLEVCQSRRQIRKAFRISSFLILNYFLEGVIRG